MVSNQEKRKNAIANLLSKDRLVWKHADDVSDASDVAQGLYSSQGNVSDLAIEGTDAPQTSMSNSIWSASDGKDINKQTTLQENGGESSENKGETPLSEQIATASADVKTNSTEARQKAKDGKPRLQKMDDSSVMDAEYFAAIERGDMEEAQRIVDEAAERAGYSVGSDYQGTSAFNGAAPYGNGYFLTKEERKEAWDNGDFEGESTLGDYIGNGVDGGNLEELTNNSSYRHADDMRKEAIENVRDAIENGRNTITMYRSVPSSVQEGKFRNGDWITPSRKYAEDNAEIHGWGKDYRIIEQKVSVDDVWFDGNDIAEWGYGREKDYVNDTDFAYKNTENNRKLLDVVTRDDEGNIISPSKRFNSDKADERYQKGNSKKPLTEVEKTLRDAVTDRLRESGIEVIDNDTEGQRVLDEANGGDAQVRLQAKLSALSNAANIICGWLTDNKRGKSFTIELPETTRRMVFRAMGRDFDSHSITANGVAHAQKNHGINGQKLNGKSIPLTKADMELIPYIMTAPDYVRRGSSDVSGRVSVRFYKELSNGYVVVAEKEYKNSPNDMETITMWAELSDKATNAQQGAAPDTHVQNAILDIDVAKIRKDAEDTIAKDRNLREHRVYHGSGADFDHFDHSHMGEGEGSQAYGWGTYVTEVEGIGRTYAEQGRKDVPEFVYDGKEMDFSRLAAELSDMAGENNDGILTHFLWEWNRNGGHRAKEYLAYEIREAKYRRNHSSNPTAYDEEIAGLEALLKVKGIRKNTKTNKTNLYTIEIPEDNGKNYLDWNKPLPDGFDKEAVKERIMDDKRTEDELENGMMERDLSDGMDYAATGKDLYKAISLYMGDKAASEMLHDIGYAGIKYPADNMRGGRGDGAKNYVIFNEKDLKIIDHVRFFRTADGEADGFTVGGRIYIDPRIATSETPVHEYAHLWATALRNGNPKEWRNVVGLMKGTPVWDEVKKRYPELETDDEIADEVIAAYSGRRGAERLREEAKETADGGGGVFDKAKAVGALLRVRAALGKFWRAVADFLHIHYTSAEEVADRVMKDLLDGIDPRKMGKGEDGVRFSAKQKRALETATWQQHDVEANQATVVSSAAGAKIVKNLDTLANTLEEKTSNRSKTFMGDVARALGASEKGSSSQYATFETVNGSVVTIRLANHNASSARFDNAGRDNAISIVITNRNNEGVSNDGNAHIVEFYYNKGKLTRADGKPLAEIVRSIKQALYSGEFKDTTGLAERQEVNGADVVRYQFIGEKGAGRADHAEEVTTRLDNLSVAREMEVAKKDAKAIKMATGWERGADGKWRYEIPDCKVSSTMDIGGKVVKRNEEDMLWTSGKLGDVVDAPELLAAYPELEQVRLETDEIMDDMPSNGEYNPRTNTITIHADELKYLNSILNHEIQHAIQHLEGFARGGNPADIDRGKANIREVFDKISNGLDDAAKLRGIPTENEWLQSLDGDAVKVMEKQLKAYQGKNFALTRVYVDNVGFDNHDKELLHAKLDQANDIIEKQRKELGGTEYIGNSFEAYRRLGGEVESRNVEKRMGMAAEERRASLAAETEDVSREDQIFLMDEGEGDSYSLREADGEENAEVKYRTSGELDEEYGDRWKDEQTNDDGRHTTQVKNTLSSYRKFGDWVKRDSGGRKVEVLDASSGLGIGTEWMRANGINAEDVEPYPSENRTAPTYRSYGDIDKKYDYIISNAVLNVIPDDWRADVLHKMADKLRVGGKLVINVRGAESIRKQGKEGETRITLDDPSEILVLRPNGSIKAYQKGFTKAELKEWCETELGEGYSVETANERNAGGSYDTAVVVTKNDESDTFGIASEAGRPRWSAQAVPNSDSKLGNNGETVNRLAELYEILTESGMGAHEFLYCVAKAFGLRSGDMSRSFYRDLSDSVGIRISDHSANTDNIVSKNGNDEVYGLVVKLSKNNRFKSRNDANYLEYVYYPDKLSRGRQAEIVDGLKGFLMTGDYTRLPAPDRVNSSGKFEDALSRSGDGNAALGGDTREAMAAMAVELAGRLNTAVRIVRTDEEVAALPSARQRRMKGSFNPMMGEVTVVVPNNADVADVENTFLHEVVGHDGLRVLFPEEEKLNNALDELYNVSKDEIRNTIDRMAQKMYDAEVDRLRGKKRKAHEANGDAAASGHYYADMAEAHAEAGRKRGQFRREATEEYGAELAGRIGESGFEKMSADELTFWGKLKAMLQKALQKLLDGLKIPGKKKWGDKEWAFVLHEAYKRKKNGGRPTVFDAADTEVMRRKTGFGDTKFSDGKNTPNEPKPIGHSTFGSVYNQFKGKVLQAVKFLVNHESGDLLGVFHRNDIGDIDMVWGDEGGGLCHILNKHINDKDFPTVKDLVSRIEDIIHKGEVDERHSNADKLVLVKDGYLVTIRKNVRENGKKIADKNWVLTAYNKDASATTKAPVDGTYGSTAVAPDTSSDAKIPTLFEIDKIPDGKVSEDGLLYRKPYGGNSGYVGYSISRRGAEAKAEGRYPKTEFRKEYGITEPSLKALVEAGVIDGGEWHHTSSYGNRTAFYGWSDGNGAYHKATLPPMPKSRVAVDMPNARNTRLIVESVGEQRPFSNLHICERFTPIFSPSSSCVRLCWMRTFLIASPT